MSESIKKSHLNSALQILSRERLLAQIFSLREKIPGAEEFLSNQLLVKGKDVHQYHADTDSEDDELTYQRGSKEGRRMHNPSERVGAIAIADDAITMRYVACENCEKEFDVTDNGYRTCIWHTGMKSVNDENDFWCDHDEDCHGLIDDFRDDPDMAEGFIWDCCEKDGNDAGCQFTKHKAQVNLVVRSIEGVAGKRARQNDERVDTGLSRNKKLKV